MGTVNFGSIKKSNPFFVSLTDEFNRIFFARTIAIRPCNVHTAET